MNWIHLTGIAGLVLGGLSACTPPPTKADAEPETPTPVPIQETEASRADVSIATMRERALATLEAVAVHSDDPALRANALEGLEQTPVRAEPLVRRGLQDPNEGVRTIAALVAGRAGLRTLEPELRSRANDPSERVRLAVIYALRTNGLEADPSPLGRALFSANDPRVRAHAAFILGELGDPSALPMLRQAANEPMPRAEASLVAVMRFQIGEALIKLGDPEPLQGLRAALYPSRPEDLELTALAVQIIGAVEDQASIGQLIYLSATKDGRRFLPPEVRLSVAQSLGRMGRDEGSFLGDEYARHPSELIREQAAHVYGWTLDSSEVRRLDPLLTDPSVRVRVAAASGILRVSATSDRFGAARP